MHPRVKVGARYPMEEGQIEIDSIQPIGFPDITPQLARESGFLGIVDLLKVAKHGKGENIYLVRFHYLPPRGKQRQSARAVASASARPGDSRRSASSPRRRQK